MINKETFRFFNYTLQTRWKMFLFAGPGIYLLLLLFTALALPFARHGGGLLRFIASGDFLMIGAGVALAINMTFGVFAQINRAVGSRRLFILFPASKGDKIVGLFLYGLLWAVMNYIIGVGSLILTLCVKGEANSVDYGGVHQIPALLFIAAFVLFAVFFALIRQHNGIYNALLFVGLITCAVFVARLNHVLLLLIFPGATSVLLSLFHSLFMVAAFGACVWFSVSRLSFKED
ncbi:MAG TPA: hypothetical protein ENN72_00375 [Firmicutes bacterium]|mgnify:CR=1 FL=1|nr:hypothetical protein [Bacillota bacterium]